jgi:hypothetical protein
MRLGAYVNLTEHVLTQDEPRGLWGMLPGANTYGARYAIDCLSHGVPRQQPQH